MKSVSYEHGYYPRLASWKIAYLDDQSLEHRNYGYDVSIVEHSQNLGRS